MKKRLALYAVLGLLTLACAPRKDSTVTTSTAGASMNSPTFRISSENADAAEPAIDAGPDGSLYVAWVEHRPNREADVMLERLDSSGRETGKPVRVNSEPGKATAWRGDPPTISVAGDGTVYVGWTARVESASGHATDIYVSSSQDCGRSFGEPSKVNDDHRPNVHGMHSLAISKDGVVYVAWLDERNIAQPKASEMAQGHHMESNREVFVSSSRDGGKTFSPNLLVAKDACPCCKTALAIGPDNRVYLGWRQVLPGDLRHIAIASSSDAGKSFSKAVIVSNDQWVLTGCPVSGPAQAVASDGTLRVLWYSEGRAGEKGLYWSESRDGGQTFTPRKLFSSGQTSGNPVVLVRGTDHLNAVWTSGPSAGSRLELGRLDAEGHIARESGAANAELPAAVMAGNKLFISYVARTEPGRSIWLTSN